VNVARCLYVGMKVMNFTEDEVWGMTLRKFYLMYDQHLEYNGKSRKNSKAEMDLLF